MQSRKKRTTLPYVVRRAFVAASLGVALTGGAFITVSALADEAQIEMNAGSETNTSSDGSGALTSAETLMEQHDCWTSSADAPSDMVGQRPGHVVATTIDDPGGATYSTELVDPALAEVETAGVTTLIVHGFCR